MSSKPNQNCEYWVDRAQTYNGLGRYHEALEALNQALTVDCNCILAYLNLGATYLFLNQYDLALNASNEALVRSDPEGRPFDLQGRYIRTLSYLMLENYQSAIVDCNYLIKQKQRSGNRGKEEGLYLDYLNRGKAYVGLKEYQRAIADFNHAEETGQYRMEYGKDLIIRYHRGNAYLACRMYRQAFQDLNYVQSSFDPDRFKIDPVENDINQESLRRNWKEARRLMEEGQTSRGEKEESVSKDQSRKQWWQRLIFWS